MPKISRRDFSKHFEVSANKHEQKGNSMLAAVNDVINHHHSLRVAAETHGISKSALQRNIQIYNNLADEEKEHYSFIRKHGFKNIFSLEEENILVEYLLDASNMCYGLTEKGARLLAFEYAVANHKRIPLSWEEKRCAGVEWLFCFRKRHPVLRLRTPEATSLARATSFNRHNVDLFFSNLRRTMERHNFTVNQIYNCDETSVTTVHKPPKILAPCGKKQVGKITSAERGTLVTMCATICANGTFVPPFFIFPRKNFRPHMLNGAPPGSVGVANPTGWMTAANFEEFINHFIESTGCSNDRKALLIMDNHESHYGLNVLRKAKENGIVILTIPPHTSHRLQPLDLTCFGPFKTYYNRAMDQWLLSNPGVPVNIYSIATIVGKSFPEAFSPVNICKGFLKSGIYPLNPQVFTDADFMGSYVTDRPLEEATSSKHNNDDTNNCSSEEATSYKQTNKNTNYRATEDIIVTQYKLVSPEQVRPHPKAKAREEGNKRKRAKSTVLTETPNMQELEESHAKKEEEKLRKEERQKNLQRKNIKKKILASSSSSDEDVDEKELCESSGNSALEDNISDEDDEMVHVNDYVLVKYSTKKSSRYYAGRVLEKSGCDVSVSFLKRGHKKSFIFPEKEDVDTIDISAVVMKLPKPQQSGGSERAAKQFIFSYDLSSYNIY